MNCFFWNTGRQRVNEYLIDAIEQFNLDVIALAEYTDNKDDLLVRLLNHGIEIYHIPQIACKRIEIFTRIKPEKIIHQTETAYYTMKRIPHPILEYINFVFVHFPSKLFMEDFDYSEESKEFRREVEIAEAACGSNHTVLVGDFNMNPFEDGLMTAAALHAFPTRQESSRISRTVKGRTYNMFYNPMWNFFGDMNLPKGTYYYAEGSHHYQLYWNILDHVLVRPNLMVYLPPDQVKIIDEVKGNRLVNDDGVPNVSDHLPLQFNLNRGE